MVACRGLSRSAREPTGEHRGHAEPCPTRPLTVVGANDGPITIGTNSGTVQRVRATGAVPVNSLRGFMCSEQARQESNLQPPVLEASLPSPPKTRRLPKCPRKIEIARQRYRARPQ